MMAELFQTSKQNVSHHIQIVYEERELEPEETVKKYLTVRREGNRDVHHKLDMKDWEQKLDEFLRFNDRKVLPNDRKMSKKDAEGHAGAEYERFEVRRREYKKSLGEADYVKQLEEAVRQAPARKKGEAE